MMVDEKPVSHGLTITRHTVISLALVVVIVGAAVSGAVSITTLKNEVGFLTLTVQEMKAAILSMKSNQNEQMQRNSSDIVLLIEKERNNAAKIEKLEGLVRKLERKNN